MAGQKRCSNAWIFNRGKASYVITPTFNSLDELEAAVAKLMEFNEESHSNGRISQWSFLKILGMRRPIGLREYKNDVLLNTGVVKHVNDYYYMQFDTVKSNRTNIDSGLDVDYWERHAY